MRILLVDDHPIVREGYRRLLERQAGYRVVAEAQSAHEAVSAYREHRPDIVVMDVSLSDVSGIEALRRIVQENPYAHVLMFTMHDNACIAKKALEGGARGYVTKNATPSELLEAIGKVGKGQIALSADIAHAIAVNNLTRHVSPVDALTPREIEIFRLLAQGRTIEDIAKALHLSAKTVHNNRTQLKAKLNVTGDAHLVLLALEHGLFDRMPR